MGCASSAHTYPGERINAQAPHSPAPSQFQNGQATAHFVSYGGGNALVLQQGGNSFTQTSSMQKKELVQVTLPPGVSPGQKIHVQAPNGRLNEITVPDGMGPGSTFTVEFADQEAPQKTTYTPQPSAPLAEPTFTANAPIAPTNHADDGFVSGFGYVPASTAGNYSSYPSAKDARPVYSSAPSYPY